MLRVMGSLPCLLAFFYGSNFFVEAANTGILTENEAKSTARIVNATKDSPVNLHWNYTYGGDTLGTKYMEQVIAYQDSYGRTFPLARRINENGALKVFSSVPVTFSGRIKILESNNAVVIDKLKYNDSSLQFMSYVIMRFNGVNGFNGTIHLKPYAVTVIVNGVPSFLLAPPPDLLVSESSNFTIRIQMDANPKPMALFRWPHDNSKTLTAATTQIYPFIYHATYTAINIPASYCGRYLYTRITNSIGASSPRRLNVTVSLKLDSPSNLQAKKIAETSSLTYCVVMNWSKQISGCCFVKYEIRLKDVSQVAKFTEIDYNVGNMTKCGIPEKINITEVQLIISFKTTTKSSTTKVREMQHAHNMHTTYLHQKGKPTSSSNIFAMVGGGTGAFLFVVVVVVLIAYFVIRKTEKETLISVGENEIENVREFVYLENVMTNDDKECVTDHQIAKATAKFNELRKKHAGRGPTKKLYNNVQNKVRKHITKVQPRYSADHEENLWLRSKVREINEALDCDPVDVNTLRELAISEYGFVTDDIRCRVWPKLLNVNIYDLPKRKKAEQELKEFRENKYCQQVKLDIDRSHRRFPSGTRVSRRRVLQSHLTNIIMRTLCRNPELHYYQGYHDVAVTLLRVVGEDLAMALLEQLSLHHIRGQTAFQKGICHERDWDFMDVNMERTNKMLALIHPIIHKMNGELGEFIERAEVGQIFALSWLITWFGHNLERFNVIVRLFDFFIATSPFMPIYVGAAVRY
eukprot:Seg649.2 transcript_id=Seg649.2/GoldUCD/mRNA.D3Y31 product="TBC1 domain family member 20" protein_id=Seg649.2/GoldUCD/D3Y31